MIPEIITAVAQNALHLENVIAMGTHTFSKIEQLLDVIMRLPTYIDDLDELFSNPGSVFNKLLCPGVESVLKNAQSAVNLVSQRNPCMKDMVSVSFGFGFVELSVEFGCERPVPGCLACIASTANDIISKVFSQFTVAGACARCAPRALPRVAAPSARAHPPAAQARAGTALRCSAAATWRRGGCAPWGTTTTSAAARAAARASTTATRRRCASASAGTRGRRARRTR